MTSFVWQKLWSWSKVGSWGLWSHWGLGFRHQVFSLATLLLSWWYPTSDAPSLLPQNDPPSCKHYILVEECVKQEAVGRSKCFLLAYHSLIFFLSAFPISRLPPHLTLSFTHTAPLEDDSPYVSLYKINTCLPLDQSLGNETILDLSRFMV